MRHLIIDTDGGSDDIFAIALACQTTDCQVDLISCVQGNVTVKQARQNIYSLLNKLGKADIPIYLGSDRPLLAERKLCLDAHGEDGLSGKGEPVQDFEISKHAAILLIERLKETEPCEIIALGPLTNLAIASLIDPPAFSSIQHLYVMGGAGFGSGNISPVAEYNLWQDAIAAKIVLSSGVPITFICWDACCGESMLSQQDLEQLRNTGPLAEYLIDCNESLIHFNEKRFGTKCLDLADPAAVAVALCPECRDHYEEYFCDIEISSGPYHGALIIDQRKWKKQIANAYICTKLKSKVFKNYMVKTLKGNPSL